MKLPAVFSRTVLLFLSHSFRSSVCLLFLVPALSFSSVQQARSQTTPSIQGTAVSDAAVPTLISPASGSAGYFVLNQDLSLISHSGVDSSFNQSCPPPAGFSATSAAPRTLVSDAYNAYFTAQASTGPGAALTTVSPEVLCGTTPALPIAGGTPTQSLAANDIYGGYYFLVSGFGGSGPDTLTIVNNLNRGTSALSQDASVNLDTGARYTSVVTDSRSDFGLAAVTELKTSTSPGNLWIYDPITQKVFKILGPGGVALPAVTSFIIPAQTDGGGDILVLVNQDGLTADNINDPPLDTTPFTMIDLGQLRPVFATVTAGNTITLPFVTQITATTSFYAMLGAAYNPVDHRVYAIVAGASTTGQPVESILSYDTLNPSAPGEIVVADVSNIPFSFQAYPQLALNAASGTMQILTSNPAAVYSVGITGTGNAAVLVPASTFPDSSFQPTFITANPLQGETYIASASGQVDVLTRPAPSKAALTVTLTGSDLGYTNQPYTLKILALFPTYDTSLSSTTLTVTATAKGGTPFTFVSGNLSDYGYPGGGSYDQMFPAAGEYTLVATAPASANYAAVTSSPLHVFVGNTGVYPTTVTLAVPATAVASNGEAQLNATVTLTGSTYGPTGQVYIQDPTGAEVGNIQLPTGVIANPITVPITINEGVQTLIAVYSGDDQNQSSTSSPQTITVGTVAKVTPTFTLTLPATAVTGKSVAGNLKFLSTSTTAPTGTVTIYATLAGSTTANQIATVSAAAAFTSGGAGFNFTAPAAGSYSVSAGYGGDSNYNNVLSPATALTITGAALQTTAVGLVAPATAAPGTAFNVVVGFNVEGAFTTQPTGNITLTAKTATGNAIILGTVTPAQGMAPGGANVSSTLPTAGFYTLSATYSGDSLYAASSNTAAVTVNALSTSLKVSAGANQTAGTPFTVTVMLTSAGSTSAPTGNLLLTAVSSTTTSITLATVSAAQAIVSGGAQVQVTIPSSGAFTLNATYAGDTNFSGSDGSAQVAVAEPTLTPTTLGVSGPASTTTGTTFTVTATLRATATQSAPITGNVTLTATGTGTTSGSYTLGTITAAQAIASGGAQFAGSIPAAGTYTVSATYPGDSNYAKSSGSIVVTVTQTLVKTAVDLSFAPTQISPGTSLDINVILSTYAKAPAAVTGNVVLTASQLGSTGDTPIQLGSVNADAANNFSGTTATVKFPAGVSGNYVIVGSYAGDTYHAASASQGNIIGLTGGAAVVTLTGPSTAVAGASLQLNVRAKLPLLDLAGPAITVTSTVNGGAGPQTTVSAPAADSDSGAVVPFVFPGAGTYTLIAKFPGDSLNTAGSSSPLTVVVSPAAQASFTMVLNTVSTAVLIAVDETNASGKTLMTLTAVGGFNTPVALTAAPSKPSKIVFSFEDASGKTITSLTPSAMGAPVTIRASGPTYMGMELPPNRGKVSAYFSGGLLCLLVAGFNRRSLRVRKTLTLLGFAMVIGLLGSTLSACADGLDTMNVVVTATPTNAAPGVMAQTVTFKMAYTNQLEP